MRASLTDAVWQLSTAMFEYVTSHQQTVQTVLFLFKVHIKMTCIVSRAACEDVVVAR